MSNWIVSDRITGAVVHAYGADAPGHFDVFPLETFNHIKETLIPEIPAPRIISGVSYLRRFTSAERIAIRAAATQNAQLDDYVKLLDATIAQGNGIDLDDADTVAALATLEAVGLLVVGRAAEIRS